MQSDRHRRLSEAIHAFDARLQVLSDLGIDLSRPGRELLADLRARRDGLRWQQEERERVQREADRLLPELLDLYRNGSDEDREFIRDLLSLGLRMGADRSDRDRRRCPQFACGLFDEGWRQRLSRPDRRDRPSIRDNAGPRPAGRGAAHRDRIVVERCSPLPAGALDPRLVEVCILTCEALVSFAVSIAGRPALN